MNSTTMHTPAGPLTIVATDAGAVRAAGFTADAGQVLAMIAPDLRADPRPRPDLAEITTAVEAYLAGDLTAIDAVPVEQRHGGDLFAEVWRVLRQVKPGDQVTYTELAARAGRPAAVRAVASACARNAAALFVPCHRVLRADGGPGGYRWGTDVKRWLRDHEQGPPTR